MIVHSVEIVHHYYLKVVIEKGNVCLDVIINIDYDLVLQDEVVV